MPLVSECNRKAHLPPSLHPEILQAEHTTGKELPPLLNQAELRAALIRALFDPKCLTGCFLDPQEFARARMRLAPFVTEQQLLRHATATSSNSWMKGQESFRTISPVLNEIRDLDNAIAQARIDQSKWPSADTRGKLSLDPAIAPLEVRVFLNMLTLSNHSGGFKNHKLTPQRIHQALSYARQSGLIVDGALTEAGVLKFEGFIRSSQLPPTIKAHWYADAGSRPTPQETKVVGARLQKLLPAMIKSYSKDPERFLSLKNEAFAAHSSARITTVYDQLAREMDRVRIGDKDEKASGIEKVSCLIPRLKGTERRQVIECIENWFVPDADKKYPQLPPCTIATFSAENIYPKQFLAGLAATIRTRIESQDIGQFNRISSFRADCLLYLSQATQAGAFSKEQFAPLLSSLIRPANFGPLVSTSIFLAARHEIRGLGEEIAYFIEQQDIPHQFPIRITCSETKMARPESVGAADGALLLAQKNLLSAEELARVIEAIENYINYRNQHSHASTAIWWKDQSPKVHKLSAQLKALQPGIPLA